MAENTKLQEFLQAHNPSMTKEAMAGAIKEIEDSFIKAATGEGAVMSAADLVKLATESPDQWNQLVNNYVGECIVAAEQEKQAAEMQKRAALEKQAQSAEAIALGQLMAHAMVDELTKIGEEMYAAKKADDEKDEKKDDDKDEKKDKDDKHENPFAKKDDDKGEKKDESNGMPPALQQAMAKEEKKEGSKLPLNVRVIRRAIEKKAEAGIDPSTQEEDFLALCKLAEAGHKVDFTGVA